MADQSGLFGACALSSFRLQVGDCGANVKHQLSDDRIAYLTRPFSHTGRFWGAALVACFVAPYGFWKLLPLQAAQIAVLATFLLAAASVGVFVVLVRRLMRPAKSTLKSTAVDVTPTGVWRETSTARTLLMPGAAVKSVTLYRNKRNELSRIVLDSGSNQVELSGLADMEGLLADLRDTYARAKFVENSAA